MRPLALRLRGFTSFRDEQEIDFTDLDLFALWGPTGSGKSSILDAITYALYGKVERVEGIRGETLANLITHGQPRMAVTLDFESDGKSFRITRSTSRTAPTKVRLERREGEDWVSYGEGADTVRDVNRILPQLVGLDYDAFTRSVVLPQGKFAEFLVGDAKDRREILTELLGLELFGRMAQRSNEIARDARSALDANTRVVEAEYSGIDEDAVKHAANEAKHLEAAAQVAADAEKTLEELEDEWAEQNDAAETLVDLGKEVEERRATYESQALLLERHARELEQATAAAVAAKDRVETLRSESERLARDRSRLEDEHGTLEDLALMKGNVASLRALELEVKRAEKVAAEQNALQQRAQKELDARNEAVRKADDELRSAEEALDAREAEHERAHRSDLVGALTHDLAAGDPCPVCERPLEQLPPAEAADLKAAGEARLAAQKEARRAQETASSQRVSQARAAEALEVSLRRCSECAAEVELKKEQLDDARNQIEERLAGAPDELLQEIDRRVAALKDLLAAEKKAAAEFSSATDEAGTQQEALSRITTKIAGVRGSIEGAPLKPLLVQIKRALGRAPKITVPGSLPETPEDAARAVRRICEQMANVESEMSSEVSARHEHAAALVQKARESLPAELDVEAEGIKPMLLQLRTACRTLAQQAALARKEAKTIEKKLAKRRELESAMDVHRREQAVYSQLHRELKSDHIVQFLQAEAQSALAAAAGEHLSELSDGRYKLAFDEDRFYVIDAWNGDEQRSARTLSGGETFLASLALALALSEQVQLLAVTERARLQSLFLDEGFGSLDAETLDLVVSAISRLGSDGRLVGIITHVPELAEAMPVRIEVLKGPRGSTIQTGDGAGVLAGV